ncbi:hypothetical protein F11_06095 [Rhodospirillum rubrum F11]|nr:hypothetical protein F11_06095 [Rhodospirillum rubrum F11]
MTQTPRPAAIASMASDATKQTRSHWAAGGGAVSWSDFRRP